MKICALTLSLLLIYCGGSPSGGRDRSLEPANLLPEDDDIQGWRRSGEVRTASDPDELYSYIDGEAVLYTDHGFESYASQLYTGPGGVELEVAVYDQGSPEDARALYEDPRVVPSPSRALEDIGDVARVDEGGLFHYGVEFVKGRFFVRVTVQDKTEDGLNTALLFAIRIDRSIG